MKSYYELLEIPRTANSQDIKRAYFGLAKKFPPERFPEAFKELRTAYETLSDERKRAEYDKAGFLPAAASELLRAAAECTRLGRYKQAAEILRSALNTYPEFDVIKENLALSLERDGKTGAAMKLWEELCEREPGNGEYAFRLAFCCERRGWNKKAKAHYERAVMLDDGNERYWLSYIRLERGGDIYDTENTLCGRAIAALRGHGAESVMLYAYGVDSMIENDLETARGYLADMGRVMQSRPVSRDDEIAVSIALDAVMASQNPRLFPLVRRLADMLPRVGDELTGELARAGIIFDIDMLEDKGFPQPFHDMFATLFSGCTCDNCKYELLNMECYMLDNLPTFRPLLNRLKKEFPHLYDMRSVFFDEVLRTHEPEKMISRRVREAVKLKPMYGEDVFLPEGLTVRRDSPKIGRNDPCPCGSGKKYKRCCGMNV